VHYLSTLPLMDDAQGYPKAGADSAPPAAKPEDAASEEVKPPDVPDAAKAESPDAPDAKDAPEAAAPEASNAEAAEGKDAAAAATPEAAAPGAALRDERAKRGSVSRKSVDGKASEKDSPPKDAKPALGAKEDSPAKDGNGSESGSKVSPPPKGRMSVLNVNAPECLTAPQRASIAQSDKDSAMQAHLFGGEKKAKDSPKARMSVSERASVLERIQAPKKAPCETLDERYTFRPSISETSRQLAKGSEGAEPRYMALSKTSVETREKVERMSLANAENEMAKCTFAPDIGDPARFAGVQAKFMDSGYDRYKKDKKEKEPTASPRGKKGAKSPRTKASSPGSPESPEAPSVTSPQSPRQPMREGIREAAEEKHLARAATARELKARREAEFAKMGAPTEAVWMTRRQTTTPVPFCSHTGLRNKQRRQNEEEKALMMSPPEAEKLFKELHEQLHSLEFGGPPGWLS